MMNRNNVKNEDGSQAQNTTGSCVALALAAVTGMTYEQSTKWHLKNTNCSRQVRTHNGNERFEHVAGVRTVQVKEKYRNLGRKVVMTKLGFSEARLNDNWGPEGWTYRDELKTQGWDAFGPSRMKVETFAKKFPKGRHVVMVKRHAVAIINGKIVNNGEEGSWFKNQVVLWYMTF